MFSSRDLYARRIDHINQRAYVLYENVRAAAERFICQQFSQQKKSGHTCLAGRVARARVVVAFAMSGTTCKTRTQNTLEFPLLLSDPNNEIREHYGAMLWKEA